ncbi:MetQ/NlpA family ABC transporter substrate-binding protein [Methylobacterium sp. 13MFTsu3.1M2]|uniref:MetQ/NlpA family ABC transporter substrate-binding protein n=1 Tax=Methylobacterium sp. 13MFTsu3.1M2 TaxID=1502776 RepID=UPI0008F21DB2|nr:MetQ/NlpA family ABC transporter substrate-binding protein [Methylobacterium sp. 13MFTsu3.1M2]SFD77852.1 D-methionine transport system substrate-binding protein [Methylobacterium sp. 13MFTsu3.1M2]
MRRLLLLFLALVGLAVAPAMAADKIKVGIMGGDAEVLWAKAKEIAARDGLDINLVVFSDYLLPNEALQSGDLDANAFQHKPFLANQVKARGYKIVPVGETIVTPIGLYSKRIKAVGDLKDGAQIGIPNDPSNGGRALLLLQAEKLIRLKDGVGLLPTVFDVVDNPKRLKFQEVDAAQLPRSLEDLDAAVINTNYAVDAGLIPGKDSIAIESKVDNPYNNVIVVREADTGKPWVPKLVHAFQNDAIRQILKEQFPGQFPAF